MLWAQGDMELLASVRASNFCEFHNTQDLSYISPGCDVLSRLKYGFRSQGFPIFSNNVIEFEKNIFDISVQNIENS